MLARSLVTAALLAFGAAASAQVPNPSPTPELPYDPGYDRKSTNQDAVNAQEAPVTRSLNRTSATGAAVITADADAADAAQAHYQEDLDAYAGEVRAHRRAAMRNRTRYNRQQHAYADAMRVWRIQTDACNRGKLKACKLPTPNPADFY